MATLSLDLRQRILASYDKEEGTREQIAWRYGVSLGMVKSCSSIVSPCVSISSASPI